uniref:Uncharacterized protein n=1 Tax=Arundo donax TaxID=35708 RepID=A0A0A9DIG1_ARUDO
MLPSAPHALPHPSRGRPPWPFPAPQPVAGAPPALAAVRPPFHMVRCVRLLRIASSASSAAPHCCPISLAPWSPPPRASTPRPPLPPRLVPIRAASASTVFFLHLHPHASSFMASPHQPARIALPLLNPRASPFLDCVVIPSASPPSRSKALPVGATIPRSINHPAPLPPRFHGASSPAMVLSMHAGCVLHGTECACIICAS